MKCKALNNKNLAPGAIVEARTRVENPRTVLAIAAPPRRNRPAEFPAVRLSDVEARSPISPPRQPLEKIDRRKERTKVLTLTTVEKQNRRKNLPAMTQFRLLEDLEKSRIPQYEKLIGSVQYHH